MSVTQINPAPEVAELSPEQFIIQHLEHNGQKSSWLAERIGVSIGHLHNVLKSPPPFKKRLTPDLRSKINEVLKTNY